MTARTLRCTTAAQASCWISRGNIIAIKRLDRAIGEVYDCTIELTLRCMARAGEEHTVAYPNRMLR